MPGDGAHAGLNAWAPHTQNTNARCAAMTIRPYKTRETVCLSRYER